MLIYNLFSDIFVLEREELNMPDIGKRIRKRREELEMTQEELADKLHYKSKTTIAKIENGTNDIVQSKVVEFAEALKTSPAYLMGWVDIAEETRPTKQELEKIKSNSYENLVIIEMKKMNQKGKVKLLDTAREMVCNPLYNPDYEIEVNAAHARTDIDIPDGTDTSDNDIMDDDNF